MATRILHVTQLFEGIWKRITYRNIPVKFGKNPVNSFLKEEFTDARTDERTDDGHNAMTIALWPLASGAKNMYITEIYMKNKYKSSITMNHKIKKNNWVFFFIVFP